jgi:MYXO-CTERM domain-containing protein
MRRASLVLLGFAAIALAPSTAWAKEITGATICGDDGCRAVTDERLLPSLVEGGPPTNGPSGKAEHFVARITVDGDGEKVHFSMVVLPDQGLLQGEDGSWMKMTRAGRNAYAALTLGREPRAARRMGESKPLPEARVDEVVLPPDTATSSSSGGGTSAWPWVFGGAAVVAVVLALLLARRRGWPGAPARLAR